MARKSRVIGRGVCHHVYAWGNDRHPVFKAEKHYREYLRYLETYSGRFCVDVVCYALMSWHVHLSLFDRLGKLPQFMRGLHGRYAQYYNKQTSRVGHVFGERYNNRIVQTDEDNVWLSRYIHKQAVDAGIARHPAEYEWTSFRAYEGSCRMGFLKPGVILDQFGQGVSARRRYVDFVLAEDDGPVDWSDPSSLATRDDVPGDQITDTFVMPVRDNLSDVELIARAAERLSVSPRALLDPKGQRERKLRHEAFSILVRGYGLTASRTSRLFGVTPRTVAKAVWRGLTDPRS